MNKNDILLQIKLLDLNKKDSILNSLLNLMNDYNIEYELRDYIDFEIIKESSKNVQKECYNIFLIIEKIFIMEKLEYLLDLLIEEYSSKKIIYLLSININNKKTSIRINKKGDKIYTKNQKRLIGLSF